MNSNASGSPRVDSARVQSVDPRLLAVYEGAGTIGTSSRRLSAAAWRSVGRANAKHDGYFVGQRLDFVPTAEMSVQDRALTSFVACQRLTAG
jgi:hypothetical protein